MKKSTTWMLLTAVCTLGTFTVGPVFIALYVLAIIFVGWPRFTSSNEVSPETQALADQIAAKEQRLREIDVGIAAIESRR